MKIFWLALKDTEIATWARPQESAFVQPISIYSITSEQRTSKSIALVISKTDKYECSINEIDTGKDPFYNSLREMINLGYKRNFSNHGDKWAIPLHTRTVHVLVTERGAGTLVHPWLLTSYLCNVPWAHLLPGKLFSFCPSSLVIIILFKDQFKRHFLHQVVSHL